METALKFWLVFPVLFSQVPIATPFDTGSTSLIPLMNSASTCQNEPTGIPGLAARITPSVVQCAGDLIFSSQYCQYRCVALRNKVVDPLTLTSDFKEIDNVMDTLSNFTKREEFREAIKLCAMNHTYTTADECLTYEVHIKCILVAFQYICVDPKNGTLTTTLAESESAVTPATATEDSAAIVQIATPPTTISTTVSVSGPVVTTTTESDRVDATLSQSNTSTTPVVPTKRATAVPTTRPTEVPTARPTEVPTTRPTEVPTTRATAVPVVVSTVKPPPASLSTVKPTPASPSTVKPPPASPSTKTPPAKPPPPKTPLAKAPPAKLPPAKAPAVATPVAPTPVQGPAMVVNIFG